VTLRPGRELRVEGPGYPEMQCIDPRHVRIAEERIVVGVDGVAARLAITDFGLTRAVLGKNRRRMRPCCEGGDHAAKRSWEET
jgi:hypothetical protein